MEPGVEADLIDGSGAQLRRVHPVVRGRLVQTDERVRIVPMPARTIMTIDDHHRRIALSEQRIRERHPGRTRTHDQIVDIDR